MSYEVDKRSEVKERLEDIERDHGIDSVDDIRRDHGSRRHRIAAAGDAAQLNLHADAAPGQLAADYAALETARSGLAAQLGTVNGLILQAALLASPMSDGHGPIAQAMKAAFTERAQDADGAVTALTAYRDELDRVVQAITQTMTMYQQIDSDLAQNLSATGEQHG